MKFKSEIKKIALIVCMCSVFAMLSACENDPVDQACDTVEEMAEQKDNTREALDAFHSNADAKESEADAILDSVS